jgi:hypothetical protein
MDAHLREIDAERRRDLSLVRAFLEILEKQVPQER